jgi:lysophospholipase L1-like esterase
MSQTKKIELLADDLAKRVGVQRLANRPNVNANQYGEAGLSASDLKKRFDAFPEELRIKINEIINMLGGDEATSYIAINYNGIPVKEGATRPENLYDLLMLIANGDFANNFIRVNQTGTANSWWLEDIINELHKNVADLTESTGNNRNDINKIINDTSVTLEATATGHRVNIKLAGETVSFEITNGKNGTEINFVRLHGGMDEDVTFYEFPYLPVGRVFYDGDTGGFYRVTALDEDWLGQIKATYLGGGAAGKDGVSPTVEISEIEGGHRVSITDKDGTKSFDVMDGASDSPEIIITENAVGYWWNNNGVPTFYTPAEGGTCSKETNYIKATEGDVFKVTTRGSDGHCANGAWYDVNQNLVSVIIFEDEEQSNITTRITAPAGVSYVRFFSMTWWEDITDVTLEVEYMGNNASSNTGTSSPLKGKKIVYDGDSICSSWGTSTNGGSYPKIIADIVGGTYDNQGVGGGRIVTAEGSTDTFHSIVDNIVNLPTDGDLYCFEGGVNDHWHGVPLGTFSESDYTGELDKTTYCGALETIFRYAITHFVGKPICYIITHKCPTSAFSSGYYGSTDTFADFRKKALGICEKYSIPVYDAWKDSGINSWNASQLANYFIISESTGTGDGTHPNEQGYRRYYVPQLIDLFERIMPIGATEPEAPTEPTYTNLLDEAGWTKGVYLSGGAEKTDENAYTTGYLPVTDKGTIYLKNVTMPDESGHGNRIDFYNEDKSFMGSVSLLTGGGQDVEYDSSGNLIRFYFHIDNSRFIRLSAWNIDETSIITYNEPIIANHTYVLG